MINGQYIAKLSKRDALVVVDSILRFRGGGEIDPLREAERFILSDSPSREAEDVYARLDVD